MSNDIMCPKCSSSDVMYSKKHNIHICEDCGHKFMQIANATKNIFFSYGHDFNSILVDRIKDDLEKRGHSIWIDHNKIKFGDNWRKSITEGLINSSGMIAFLSRHSVREPGVCLDEIKIALSIRHGNIKTILLENENEITPPSSLSNIQWLDMSEWTKFSFQSKEWENWYQGKFMELCKTIENEEFTSFQGEIDKIYNILVPILSNSKEKMLLSKEYIGRIWLKDILEEWRISKKSSRIFILYGGPGSGKSCFAANQIHSNPNVICGVFCEWDKGGNRPAHTIIKIIAFKLAAQLPDYRKLLLLKLKHCIEQIEAMSCKELFEYIIIQLLLELIDGGRERKLIIIDGLDEAEKNSDNELAFILAENAERLPHWLAFVITTRPESNITVHFNKYNPKILDTQSTLNQNDIQEYLKKNIEILAQTDSESDLYKTLELITTKCQGNFLYASMFIEAVKNKDICIYDIENYPDGIDSFYMQNFKRKYPDSAEYNKFRKILELLIAEQSLPVSLLIDILGISQYEYNNFLYSFGSMIHEDYLYIDGVINPIITISFCHKSIVDWLTNKNKSYKYFICIQNGTRILLNYYIKCIDKKVLPIEQLDSIRKYHAYFIQTHIIDAFIKLNIWEELEHFLLEEDTPLFPYWCCVNQFPTSWEKAPLIERLWKDIDMVSFFEIQQRRGERQFIYDVTGWIIQRYGIENLKIKIFNIFVDIVHLGGKYKEAVQYYTDYLAGKSEEDILGDQDILHIAIRRIHHSMFFCSRLPINSGSNTIYF